MTRPTILIGIGSGGLRSIEAAWKLSQEIPSSVSEDKRPLVEYIFLETDGSNKAISSEIVSCPLTLSDINASKHAVVQDPSATTSWVINQNFSDNVMNGAGGSPVVGRMTIWDKNNRIRFENSINRAVEKLNKKSLDTPLVYIVGSFGGGTGSGTFLDIAYIVRDVLSNQVEVQGLFMIPNLGISDKVIYSNTVCCIKELEYYNDENHEFPFKWNANPPKGYERQNTPFDLVQIISAAYNNTLATVTYSQLHEEAGLFLYLNMLGLYDVRRKSLVDASGNIIVSKYTTYGLAALHYPENEIRDIIGNKFASELLGKIIDDQHYFDKETNSERPIDTSITVIRNKVMRSFDSKFTNILHKWCDTIEIVEGTNSFPVEMHIENLSKLLASANSSYDEKRKTLFSFFKVGGEYYKQLRNQCNASALDSLIDMISSEIREALREYQNINVAIHALDAVEVSIEQILNFWSANGYHSDPETWNSLLKEGIVKDILPMPMTFKLQFESEKVYHDRIKYQLLYGLAMHLFSDSMSKVLKAIKGEMDRTGNRIVVTDTYGNRLPSKYQLNTWKEIVSNVKSNPDPSYNSCVQVVEALTSKLSMASNGNIDYLFPEGTLEATMKKIIGQYVTDHNAERTIADITGNDDLYQFLLGLKQNVGLERYESEKDLYRKVTQGYISKLDTGSFSVSDAINKDSQQLSRIRLIVDRAKIPHLPINPTGRNAQFQDHKNIPHVLAGFDGNDGNVLSKISKLLQENNLQGFEIKDLDRDKLSHIGLNNWLIFYKEFGQMSDDRPFNIIDDLRDFQDYSVNYATDMKNSGMKEQDYHEKRMPYLSFTMCRELAQKYIQQAGALYQKDEWERSVAIYKYAHYWDMSNSLPENQIKTINDLVAREEKHHKFDRYLSIGNRYLAEQDYQNASYYLDMADNLQPNDPDVVAQKKLINDIAFKVNNLITQGDTLCINANIDYDRCIQTKDLSAVDQCIQSYQEVLAIYENALALSKSDMNIQHKISSLNKRIQNLNNI